VAVYAGGTVLCGSKRSDGVWLFSLDGKMESLPRGAADPTGQFSRGPEAPDVTPIPGREADLKRGSDLYFGTCGACHGETGQGGTHGGAPLTPELTVPRIMTIATNGQGDMPAFGGAFTREDLQDIATFVLEDLIKRAKN
jgi:mono/diheme cytochrome c family protein